MPLSDIEYVCFSFFEMDFVFFGFDRSLFILYTESDAVWKFRSVVVGIGDGDEHSFDCLCGGDISFFIGVRWRGRRHVLI